jgi:hypothetical protein
VIREAFKLLPPLSQEQPRITKVEITDKDGVSWRDAKKQLRQWYLKEAAALRQVKQKDYFNADIPL